MNRSVLLLIVLLTILASGCVKNAPKLNLKNEGNRNLLVGQLKEYLFKKEWVEYNCANNGYYNTGLNSSNTGFSTFNCTPITKNADTAVSIRNQVLDRGLGVIDSAYDVYIRDIRKRRTIGDFLADLAEIGASTAVGITNGERAIQVIGIALTGFRGGRKSAELNLYDDQTTAVLIKRMDASRSLIVGEIRQKQRKPTGEYSFDAALDDLVRYFDVGTLNRAFTELDKQASVDAQVARLGVLKIQGLTDISQIPTAEQREVVFNVGDKLETLEEDLDSQDQKTRDNARNFLKSTYEKIAQRKEFETILSNIKTSFETDETLTAGSKARLKTAFDKLSRNEPLTGQEYLTLINTVFNKAETVELQKLLLSIFNEQ